MNIKEVIENKLEQVRELRKVLHQQAELSFQEFETQKILMDFFQDLKIPVKKVTNTGLVATLNSGESCIALRADMDALPVNGVSHACGHDYHMAIAAGTALVLKELDYKGCVKFIFQPGEETTGGALPMIQEGVLENPPVEKILGFHVWPGVKVGTIEAAAGPSMASDDDFTFTFLGKGGHGAMPHLCKHPLYPAMDFIQTMNEKSRMDFDPLESHVMTFASLQAGSASNVIPDECVVRGTVRTFSSTLRNAIHQTMLATADSCAKKYGCTVVSTYNLQYPPLINDSALTHRFIEEAKKLMGEENVLPLVKTFAAEDFAYFAQEVPAVHFRLGIEDGVKGKLPLHASGFDASEDAIYYGIAILTNFILSLEN